MKTKTQIMHEIKLRKTKIDRIKKELAACNNAPLNEMSNNEIRELYSREVHLYKESDINNEIISTLYWVLS